MQKPPHARLCKAFFITAKKIGGVRKLTHSAFNLLILFIAEIGRAAAAFPALFNALGKQIFYLPVYGAKFIVRPARKFVIKTFAYSERYLFFVISHTQTSVNHILPCKQRSQIKANARAINKSNPN